jgi:hypothetical protein
MASYKGMAFAVLALGASLVGCEEHHAVSVRGAPEYLHAALSGDIAAQEWLAACYASPNGCVGAPDPALACAWRGVRLASQSPRLSLADETAYAQSCADQDETFQQRAELARIDFTTRVYGARAAESANLAGAKDQGNRLYPSLETVRARVAAALTHEDGHLPLPAFAAPRQSADRRVNAWTACQAAVCLEGVTPAYGGGVIGYRVVVQTKAMDPLRAQRLAARLAAAGLDAPSLADRLGPDAANTTTTGPVCWSKASTPSGAVVLTASRAPCRAEVFSDADARD